MLLRSLLSSMQDLIFVLDRNGTFKSFFQSESNSDLYASPEQFVGRHFREVMPSELCEKLQGGLDALVATGVPQELEYSLMVPSGRQWFDAVISDWMNPENARVGFVVVVCNISKRKRMDGAPKEMPKGARILSGVVPICAACKKIRDDRGNWNPIEHYI